MSLNPVTMSIIKIMTSRVWPDHAQSMHALLANDLRECGFNVEFECPATKSNGRNGRIDIVCRYGAYAAAIELDCRRPRRKSVEKLLNFDGVRIIGLRGIEGVPCPDGITAIVAMRVRQASKAETSDRRTVNRYEVAA